VDFQLPPGEGRVTLNQLNLIAYRFQGNQKVEISVNGSPFKSAVGSSWLKAPELPLFSSTSLLYVGGATEHCGFVGDIFEVLGFQNVLGDAESAAVMHFLAQRHTVLLSGEGSDNTNIGNDPASTPPPDEVKKSAEAPRASLSTPPRLPPSQPDTKLSPKDRPAQSETLGHGHDGLLPTKRSDTVRPPVSSDVKTTAAKDMPSSGEVVAGDVCKTQIDPFKDMPVENFVPPKGADLKDVMMWEDTVADLKERIRKMKVGGKTLRDTIRKEVRALQLLRFQTFCKYIPSSRAT